MVRALAAGLRLTVLVLLVLVSGDSRLLEGQGPASTLQIAPVQGAKIAYESQGEGEPVVLIHGAGISDTFAPLMTQPSLQNYQRIRFHRRGYGESSVAVDDFNLAEEARDVAALMTHVGVERAHVVGHSGGALVAMEFASTFPERVQTLTLLEPPLFNAEPTEFDRVRAERELLEPAARINSWFENTGGGPDWRQRTEAIIPGAFEQAVRDARRLLWIDMRAVAHWSFGQDKARRITSPVLYVGTSDLPGEWWADLSRAERPGLTHMFLVYAPEATAEVVAAFLGRHPM